MTRNDVIHPAVSLENLGSVAARIAKMMEANKVWLFYGEMGAGKTTLIKEICRALGVNEATSSPTFALVNEYRTDHGDRVFHFDFYRIRHEAEAYDIGVDEYFYSGFPCLVEWPEKIPSLIPPVYARVDITPENETQRTIAITLHDGKEENRI
jgi:tRNA threonylcarbamoyladenosine biosynthesis protein TsaE